jgi:hypothetical protein
MLNPAGVSGIESPGIITSLIGPQAETTSAKIDTTIAIIETLTPVFRE